MIAVDQIVYFSRSGQKLRTTASNLVSLEPKNLQSIHLKSTNFANEDFVEPLYKPTNYLGQRHIGGTFWFNRSGRRLPYVSGLERLRLQYANLDPFTKDAVTQPYVLLFRLNEKIVMHIPDLLISFRNKPMLLCDVRPHKYQNDKESKLRFDITRELCSESGITYELWGEPSAVEAYNIRFVSGFAREYYGFRELSSELLSHALSGRYTIAELMSTCSGPEYLLRPTLFHLIWKGKLRFDLTKPLTDQTIIVPGPITSRAERHE